MKWKIYHWIFKEIDWSVFGILTVDTSKMGIIITTILISEKNQINLIYEAFQSH